MNAEALPGMWLGNSELLRLIGRGTLGAVYLAQQKRPHRRVAVKVFLQAETLAPADRASFLKYFRQEIDAAAALSHPHIIAIHEIGEQDGLAYLSMPYVSGGTLQELLREQGALSISRAFRYLEQLAGALDYAHDRGILHRDMKPANILITTDDRLLLTDFCITRLMTEGNLAAMREPTPGMLDYIAPELVMGRRIDRRADLYSLGAVLYHMLTGEPPFQGETLTDVAMKHVQTPPRSPVMLRKELPVGAAQVIMRSLAKRPADRYTRASNMVAALRLALDAAGILEDQAAAGASASFAGRTTGTMPRIYTPHGLFDPQWQVKNSAQAVSATPAPSQAEPAPPKNPASGTTQETHSPLRKLALRHDGEGQRTQTGALPVPSVKESTTPPPTPIQATSSIIAANKPERGVSGVTGAFPVNMETVTRQESADAKPAANEEEKPALASQVQQTQATGTLKMPGTTGALTLLANDQTNTGTTGTIKLTGPVKIVQVPVAGQPGRYVTGFLPVLPMPQPEAPPEKTSPFQRLVRSHLKILALLLIVALVLTGSGILWFTHALNHQPAHLSKAPLTTPNVAATATMNAEATTEANIILSDPLKQNIHNWPVGTMGAQTFTFKEGAYHILNNDGNKGAPALLPGEVLNNSFTYSLTMQEIKGDDASPNNEFGMILLANLQNKNGKQITMFYAFEVLNEQAGEYQFWKYDSTQGNNPWTRLWHHGSGKEFHMGHSHNSINTLKVVANHGKFTLFINGKSVGTLQDKSIANGKIGMLVNLKGTEVAFSNLLLTYA